MHNGTLVQLQIRFFMYSRAPNRHLRELVMNTNKLHVFRIRKYNIYQNLHLYAVEKKTKHLLKVLAKKTFSK